MAETILQRSILSPDTETILLLCGRFGNDRSESAAPLTAREYEALTRWLLERKMRPADLPGADAALLAELVLAKLDRSRLRALLQRGAALALALEKWQRSGLWVVSRSDATYPKRLKKKLGQSAPPLLYGAGDIGLLEHGGVAIVGSRDVSAAGLEFTQALARACVREGLGVVSGGAKGVDAAAMQAGGEADGIVVGVLAADLLRASVHRQNRQRIESGQWVLVSPFNPEAGFNAGNAMARDRLIYALADHAIVVDSAAGEGGTWGGAIENLRYGWTPLFVRDAADKPGNQALITRGAHALTWQFEPPESIKDCLAPKNLPAEPAIPAWFPSDPLVGVCTPRVANLFGVNEPVLKYADVACAQVADTSTLDMFPLFVERLSLLIGNTPKTADEIRAALGLETAQLKAWLAAAVSAGVVEKLTTPVAYIVSKQKSLY